MNATETAPPPAPLKTPPRASGRIWRNILEAVADPLGFLERTQSRHGNFVMLRENKTYLLVEPEAVARVLQENHPNYEKGPLYRKAMRPLMGEGLFTAEGENWKRQRRIAQPAFLRKHHEFFGRTISQELARIREDWTAAAREERPIDLQHELMRSTLAIALRLCFTDDLGDRSPELARAFLACEHELNIVRAFLPIPSWFPTPSALRFRRAIRVLDDFIYGCIADRRRNPRPEAADLLSMYISAKFEDTGEGLDDGLLRDEMMTLLAAGHETAADGMMWTFYLLMKHADVRRRVVEQVDEVLADGRLPELGDVESMPLVSMTAKEGMRLYPPAWGFLRTAIGPDTIQGYRVPAGARLIVSPYLTQRTASIWPDPMRFDPERFSGERSEGRHKFAWFPFGEGPRKCIGVHLAMLETAMVLATVLRYFDIELIDPGDVAPLPRVSLKPSRKVLIRAKRRA